MNAKRAILALIATGLLAGTALAQPQHPILPGYWDYKVKVLGLTVDTQKWCVSEDKVDDWFSGPCNSHHLCVYPTKEVAAGKARFKGYWQSKSTGKRADIEAEGTYAPQRFTLRTKATRGTDGTPVPATTIEATWLGQTCKAGAKTPK